MKNNTKDSFYGARMANLILGIIILFLVFLSVTMEQGKEIYYILIFALGAVENFIAATMNFAQKNKGRANVYAIVGALFLIMAVVLGVQFYGLL